MEGHHTVYLKGRKLTIEALINVAEKGYKVDFPKSVRKKISKGRKKLEKQITQNPEIAIYGTNRLHGDLKDKAIPIEKIVAYQIKYIHTHNCGTGKPLPVKIVRAMMVARLNSFAKGMSGIKMDTCQLMLDMLNKGVTPWILEEGSVGASGDLIPLSMLGAVLIGLSEAKAYYQGRLLSADIVLQMAGLQPVTLGAKEAMGISNGTNFISAWAAFSVRDIDRLLNNACITTALSLEAIRGEKRAFSTLIHEKSHRHKGQIHTAQQLRQLIQRSKRMSKAAQEHPFTGDQKGSERVQDRYSFRCMPQIQGAAYEALQVLKKTVEVEINSTNDNPLFDFNKKDPATGGILFASGGNFHGQALATVIDYMKVALTTVGLVTDKRIFSLVDSKLSYGLPANLAYDTANEADGGLMLTQYAGAARAAESRVLATPASVMSVATSANQEDYVSMGSIAALHLQKIIYNTQVLVGIELLCAHRALQLTYNVLPKKLRKLGDGTQKVYDYLCQKGRLPADKGDEKDFYLKDHYLRTDMEKAIDIVKSGEMVDLVMD